MTNTQLPQLFWVAIATVGLISIPVFDLELKNVKALFEKCVKGLSAWSKFAPAYIDIAGIKSFHLKLLLAFQLYKFGFSICLFR